MHSPPRLRGTAAGYFVKETSSAPNLTEDYEQLIFDSNLGLNYSVTEHLGMNLSYSFTNVTANRENVGYYRNRVFLGAQYNF